MWGGGGVERGGGGGLRSASHGYDVTTGATFLSDDRRDRAGVTRGIPRTFRLRIRPLREPSADKIDVSKRVLDIYISLLTCAYSPLGKVGEKL